MPSRPIDARVAAFFLTCGLSLSVTGCARKTVHAAAPADAAPVSAEARPMTTAPKRLWFIFRDGTSGKETYETARFLYSDLRDDGTTVLDFNQAYNPPCAFNPFTTCPLPLSENRLKVRIPAGEKAYAHP